MMNQHVTAKCAAAVARRMLVAAIALCATLSIQAPPARAADAKHLPNIVFIMADDMGSGDPHCYNADSKIPTPNIDRLASQGIRLTDAHTPSAVCSPTRYGVLTGRYAWRSRLKRGVLLGFSKCLIEPGRLTVASMLKQHGYATGGVGKWHLGFQTFDPAHPNAKVDYTKPLTPGPTTVGFDYYFGIPASLDMEPYCFVENDHPTEQPTDTVAASKHRRQNGGGFWRGGPIAPHFKHIDVLPTVTQKAVGFLERQAAEASGKPFFLYFPLTAPHTPWLPIDAFRGKSGAGYYGDFAAQVDWSVGQVLAALDRLNLSDNTLVFFTSDNGAHWLPADIEHFGHRANGALRGQKADIWDGGHTVPFIARWPGKIKPGTTSDQTICLTDLMATCAAVVGHTLPDDAGEDSYNILPILLGQAGDTRVREATVHHSGNGVFAIRQGNWKLCQGLGSGGFSIPRVIKPQPGGPVGQLYNLAQDPAETTNLYQDRPEVVRDLSALLEVYKQRGYSRPMNPPGK